MSALINVCPICTEYECLPNDIKRSQKLGHKFHCRKCGAEYWLKVTKEPTFENWNKDLNKKRNA